MRRSIAIRRSSPRCSRARVDIIAYETVRDAHGGLPLLAPMSRIAGRLAPLVGSAALATDRGGAGVLLTGVDDVPGARVVVVGAGNVGGEAARVAARLGARVIVFSRRYGAARKPWRGRSHKKVIRSKKPRSRRPATRASRTRWPTRIS